MAPRSRSSSESRPDVVKQQVAAHWDRRAPTFDEDFGHSIRTPDERAAWDRILDLVLGGRAALDALDVGCGTGFLAFELTARGHRVTGVDFAPAMIAQARRKAAELGVTIRFEEGDIEQLPVRARNFDLVISRHVLWTLPAPGGGHRRVDPRPPAGRAPGRRRQSPRRRHAARRRRMPARVRNTRRSAISCRSSAAAHASRSKRLLTTHGLGHVGSDPLLDLVAAQARRMTDEGREPPTRRRYVVWGDVVR